VDWQLTCPWLGLLLKMEVSSTQPKGITAKARIKENGCLQVMLESSVLLNIEGYALNFSERL
jgi:hypothetical protein